MKKIKQAILLMTIVFLSNQMHAQNLTMPQASQKAEVKQTIGLSEIDIVYHSPAVKGRVIYGDLVPYDQVWRAGANENTTFSITHDAKIEGKTLPAGVYGLHMIPTKNEWTIIFSKNYTSWGSFSYDKSEDVLRVTVKPVILSNNVEWLNYSFMDRKAESTVAYLEWERLRIPFTISFDAKEIVYQNMKNELRSLPGFGNVAHLQAAHYCMNNNFHLDDAEKWIDHAMQANPGFVSSSAKAELLEKKGDLAGSKKIMDEIISKATEAELNTYGYQLLGKNKNKEAIEIFKLNIKNHPKSWNTYDSLGEAYGNDGDKAKSEENYRLALKNNPPDDQVKRIQGILK